MRSVSLGLYSERLGARERFLFQSHIRVQVHLSSLGRFVTQPERDHGTIHTVVKKVHGCGVTADMRGHLLVFERGASLRGQMTVFGKATLDRIATESATADAGEEWVLGLTMAFP